MTARCIVCAALLSFVGVATAPAQPATTCPNGRVPVDTVLQIIDKAARDAWARQGPNPSEAPQVQAPSTASKTVSPVDNASLPGLLAFAVDNDLIDLSKQPAITVSLSPFAFVAARDPEAIDDQEKYETYGWMRHFEGALTLGGKGDAFDRDGDGKPDEALESKSLSDSIAWELRYQLVGSRDRRDKRYRDAFHEAVNPLLVDELLDDAAVIATLHDLADQNRCYEKSALDKRLVSPQLEGDLLKLAASMAKTQAAMEAARRRVDRSLVVSVFSSGIRREANLGTDRLAFGARAAWPMSGFDNTANADWSRDEKTSAGLRPTRIKLGYQATALLKPWGSEAATASLFAAWERYSDVPGAKHRTVAKAGGKLVLTLAPGVTMPLSLTWANHRDLLEGARDIVGHVGIGIDLDDKRKAKGAAK